MSIVTFFVVVLSSVLIAIVYLFTTIIWPAVKSAKIRGSLVILARCISQLNRGPFAEGKITNGGYLHDRFYKVAFMVLTHKINLKFRLLFTLPRGPDFEKRKFHLEMDALDSETREHVISGIRAMAKIMWFRNPVIFTLSILKEVIISRDFKEPTSKERFRNCAAQSAESVALKGFPNRGFAFSPIYH